VLRFPYVPTRIYDIFLSPSHNARCVSFHRRQDPLL
jgi:hypothetical protein